MCAYLKSKTCFNVKSRTYYFYMKAKTLADFQICISVPLLKNGMSAKERVFEFLYVFFFFFFLIIAI